MATINGTTLGDTLTGTSSSDTIDGRAGADTLIGLAGNDVYIFDTLADLAVELAAAGQDTIRLKLNNTTNIAMSVDLSQAAFNNIEDFTFLGTGLWNATGSAVANTLTGNASANRLDGGAGADKMIGGAGDDTFIVDNVGDIVSDTSGNDRVESSVSFTLATGIESLVLTGSAVSGTGGNGTNTLTGNALANTLDGGSGVDTMAGGQGDDTYIVNSTQDVVQEQSGQGTDTVFAGASYTLSAEVENLVLTGTGAMQGKGNAAANTITGNSGANKLDGGAGADLLQGGAGKDTYVVDDAGDVVVESSVVASETDTVLSSVDFTLGANLENLSLTAPGYTGTGNSLGNTMTGSDGADTLSGLGGNDRISGGDGNDMLDGGAGNDTLQGGDGDDSIVLDLRTGLFTGGIRQESDVLDGDNGADTLVIRLSYDQSFDTGIMNAVAAVQGFIGSGSARSFISAQLGVKLSSFSAVQVIIDPAPNTAPSDIALDNAAVGENTAGAVVGNLSVSDPDSGDTHTFSVDDVRFEVVAGQLKLKAGQSLDFETTPSVTLRVTATDAGGLSRSEDFTVTVGNANEAPTGISLSASSVAENAAGAVIGTLSTADPDAGDTHTYVVDDARFEVVAGQLKLKAGISLDFESETSVPLQVTSTDAGALSVTANFTVTVNNANEAPTDITLDNADIDEGQAGGVIGNIAVADPDSGSSFSYTVDDARFEVAGGQLKLKAGQALNASVAASVSLNVTATDNGGLAVTKGFTVTVNDIPGALLFSPGADTADFNSLVPGFYNASTFYSALDGNDTVTLPDTAAATALGYSATNIFDAGDGDDIVTGGGLGDTIHGGLGVDTLFGNDGNDTLDGGAGADTMRGGAGDDLIIWDNTADNIGGGDGTDTVIAYWSLTLTADTENLVLTGPNASSGVGNAQVNVITGNANHNFLDGLGGNDTMYGGSGDDEFAVNSGFDIVDGGSGGDTIRAAASYDLAASSQGVEILELFGIEAPTDGYGDAGDNIIFGNDSVNTIDGRAGQDTLWGNNGNDVFVFRAGSGQDLLIEGGTGTDTVFFEASVSMGSATYARLGDDLFVTYGGVGDTLKIAGFFNNQSSTIEQFSFNGTLQTAAAVRTLIGGISLTTGADTYAGTTGDDHIFGLAGDDTLTGGDGNDTLDGDTGKDTLYGGEGNDVLACDLGVGDLMDGGNGDDWLIVGKSGASGITLIGGAGNDVLVQGGGNQYLIGGSGDDTYILNSGGGGLTELAGGGNDTVEFGAVLQSNADLTGDNYTLGPQELENLRLTGVYAINGSGNSLDNHIDGNKANNSLAGMAGNDTISGGGGDDTLAGGTGADIFVYKDATSHDDTFLVTDFSAAEGDKLDIRDVLAGYDSGTMDLADFVQVAVSGSDTLITIDADGAGSGASLLAVTLAGTTGLGDADAMVAAGRLLVE